MITAWVFYRTPTGELKLEQLSGTDYASTNPTEWALLPDCEILLVLHHGFFLSAWIKGEHKDPNQ